MHIDPSGPLLLVWTKTVRILVFQHSHSMNMTWRCLKASSSGMLVNVRVMATLIVAIAWIVPDSEYPVNGSTFLSYASASEQSYIIACFDKQEDQFSDPTRMGDTKDHRSVS